MPYNYYPYLQNPPIPNQLQSGQTQNSGFVSVRSETEARNYPVAYGNSVTFKDETAPYVYTKTMGFSQLDRPIFDKYRLVKEEPQNSTPDAPNPSSNVKNDNVAIKKLEGEIAAIWREIEALKKKGEETDEHAV
jgi:hypothetical protein